MVGLTSAKPLQMAATILLSERSEGEISPVPQLRYTVTLRASNEPLNTSRHNVVYSSHNKQMALCRSVTILACEFSIVVNIKQPLKHDVSVVISQFRL